MDHPIRYSVSIRGEWLEDRRPLRKRIAVYEVVKHLAATKKYTVDAINSAVKEIRPQGIVRDVEKIRKRHCFFHAKDQLIEENGSTYALSNRFGLKTTQSTLDALIEHFPEEQIRYESVQK